MGIDFEDETSELYEAIASSDALPATYYTHNAYAEWFEYDLSYEKDNLFDISHFTNIPHLNSNVFSNDVSIHIDFIYNERFIKTNSFDYELIDYSDKSFITNMGGLFEEVPFNFYQLSESQEE
jgi:hypothetical protein